MEGFQKQASLLRKSSKAVPGFQASAVPLLVRSMWERMPAAWHFGILLWEFLELVKGSFPARTNAGPCHSLKALTAPG